MCLQVEKGVRALLQVMEKMREKKQQQSLLEEESVVNLQFAFFKTPRTKQTIKLYVRLSFSLLSFKLHSPFSLLNFYSDSEVPLDLKHVPQLTFYFSVQSSVQLVVVPCPKLSRV